ncbi:MAG TPA: hypothetical protein VNJ53_03040 [Gaiellaceae bacterium]|nr:hypothetical protein [Gaiellaceae bacterium]
MAPLVRGVPLVLTAVRVWRRLPASQRRRLLQAAGRHGPRLAARVVRRSRLFRA